jgi:hypothetical protein
MTAGRLVHDLDPELVGPAAAAGLPSMAVSRKP